MIGGAANVCFTSSNSYWIGEDTPCITYGLRGVVHATIDIYSASPDLNSGVEGGSVAEPMVDMYVLWQAGTIALRRLAGSTFSRGSRKGQGCSFLASVRSFRGGLIAISVLTLLPVQMIRCDRR